MLVAVSWGRWQDSQRIPVQPTGPKTLESKAKAEASGMVGGETDYKPHPCLSKIDLCVRPRHQKGREESRCERVPCVAMLRPWPQVAAGA